MEAIEKFRTFYAEVEKLSDPRTKDWPLVQSPWPTYISCFIYIVIAWKIGPYLMRHREPFQLKYVLVVYNTLLAYLNYHITKELLFGMLVADYSWPCQGYTTDTGPAHIRIASALWWYYASKLIEFADTAFFVLRKKNNQISFLHVYHHATMPMIWWMGIKWTPCAQCKT